MARKKSKARKNEEAVPVDEAEAGDRRGSDGDVALDDSEDFTSSMLSDGLAAHRRKRQAELAESERLVEEKKARKQVERNQGVMALEAPGIKRGRRVEPKSVLADVPMVRAVVPVKEAMKREKKVRDKLDSARVRAERARQEVIELEDELGEATTVAAESGRRLDAARPDRCRDFRQLLEAHGRFACHCGELLLGSGFGGPWSQLEKNLLMGGTEGVTVAAEAIREAVGADVLQREWHEAWSISRGADEERVKRSASAIQRRICVDALSVAEGLVMALREKLGLRVRVD